MGQKQSALQERLSHARKTGVLALQQQKLETVNQHLTLKVNNPKSQQLLTLMNWQIPALAEISQITALRSLALHDNRLARVPTELASLTGLKTLLLQNNRLGRSRRERSRAKGAKGPRAGNAKRISIMHS